MDNMSGLTGADRVPEITPLRFIYETELEKYYQPLYTEGFRIMVVSKGEATLIYKNKSYSLAKGSLCFFQKGSTFHLNTEDGLQVIYLDFFSPDLEKYFKSKSTLDRAVFSGQDSILSFFDGAIKLLRSYNSAAIMAASILYALSLTVFSDEGEREEKSTRGDFDAILDFVNTNFNDPMMSLKRVGEKFSYSEKHLSRLFKIKAGIGFNKHLNELRLSYAKNLLDEGGTSVKTVAYASGFLDPLYFSRAFKARFEIAPSEYAELKRGEFASCR